jgi:hypothetical protein
LRFIDPFGLAVQIAPSLGAQIIAPGVGSSVNGIFGINIDGWNSSIYIQAQLNVGYGGGAFAGLGGSLSAGVGDSPKTGFDSSNYGEVDAGYIYQGGVGANLDDKCENVSSVSASVPYKVGAGGGLGAFVGKSYTVTLATPTAKKIQQTFQNSYFVNQYNAYNKVNPFNPYASVCALINGFGGYCP